MLYRGGMVEIQTDRQAQRFLEIVRGSCCKRFTPIIAMIEDIYVRTRIEDRRCWHQRSAAARRTPACRIRPAGRPGPGRRRDERRAWRGLRTAASIYLRTPIFQPDRAYDYDWYLHTEITLSGHFESLTTGIIASHPHPCILTTTTLEYWLKLRCSGKRAASEADGAGWCNNFCAYAPMGLGEAPSRGPVQRSPASWDERSVLSPLHNATEGEGTT